MPSNRSKCPCSARFILNDTLSLSVGPVFDMCQLRILSEYAYTYVFAKSGLFVAHLRERIRYFARLRCGSHLLRQLVAKMTSLVDIYIVNKSKRAGV